MPSIQMTETTKNVLKPCGKNTTMYTLDGQTVFSEMERIEKGGYLGRAEEKGGEQCIL